MQTTHKPISGQCWQLKQKQGLDSAEESPTSSQENSLMGVSELLATSANI